MFRKHLVLSSAICAIALVGSADAALIAPDSITGFSGGDSYTPGNFSQLTNGVGITKGDANDPSTWTNTGGGYAEEWYDNILVSASNGKLGWLALDLGASASLSDDLYIFNGNYSSGNLGSNLINVYYADSPTISLPTPPGPNASVDYDFASGGWTLLTSTNVPKAGISVIDLSTITSQHIGIEIMSKQSTDGRTGFDEIAVTAVPEPGSLALLGLGGLMMIKRRRRG